MVSLLKFEDVRSTGRGTYGAIPPLYEGFIVVQRVVGVEQLARVVGVVPKLLEPDREVAIVVAAGDELGVAAWVRCQSNLGQQRDIGAGNRPHGGETSVTFVLWARLPVKMLTRAGHCSGQRAVVDVAQQGFRGWRTQIAVVQKCFLNSVPWSMRCF